MKKYLNLVLIGEIALNILYVLFGAALLIFPKASLDVVRIIFSLMVLITGIYQLIMYIMRVNKRGLFFWNLYFGIIEIIISLFLLFRPILITNMTVLFLGIWLIVQGGHKGLYGIILGKHKEEIAPLIFVSGIGLLLIGFLVLVYPKLVFSNITKGTGIFLLVYAIVDAINYYLLIKRSKQILKVLK